MTCRQFRSDVVDCARGITLDTRRHEAVARHVRMCASCAALAERHRVMSMALRRLADDEAVPPPDDPRLETLLAAFDTRLARPRRISVGVGLSLAASILIVAGLSIGRKVGDPAPAAAPLAGPASADVQFVLLPGANALPRFEHGQVIRVEIPSSDGIIRADVLIGQDGLARAVRLVQ